MLDVPGMCCEYSADSFSINLVANHLATLSCIGFDSGTEALCNHPSALVLPVKDKIFCALLVD